MNDKLQQVIPLILVSSALFVVGGWVVLQGRGPDLQPAALVTAEAGVDPGARERVQDSLAGEVSEDKVPDADHAAVPVADLIATEHDRAFIDEAFPVLSRWDLAAVKPLLAEVTLEGSDDERLQGVLDVLGTRLGELEHFGMPEPVHLLHADDAAQDPGAAELREYRFRAWYTQGLADVELTVQRADDSAAIYAFNIRVNDNPLASTR